MEENLNNLIDLFYTEKQQLDELKKSTTEYNKEIKEGLQELGVAEFITDTGLTAKMNVQKRESFNDEKLIQRLKELGATGAIKTVEVVDYDRLEDAIYNDELDATKLSDCKEVKEVVTLKVTKKKGN